MHGHCVRTDARTGLTSQDADLAIRLLMEQSGFFSPWGASSSAPYSATPSPFSVWMSPLSGTTLVAGEAPLLVKPVAGEPLAAPGAVAHRTVTHFMEGYPTIPPVATTPTMTSTAPRPVPLHSVLSPRCVPQGPAVPPTAGAPKKEAGSVGLPTGCSPQAQAQGLAHKKEKDMLGATVYSPQRAWMHAAHGKPDAGQPRVVRWTTGDAPSRRQAPSALFPAGRRLEASERGPRSRSLVVTHVPGTVPGIPRSPVACGLYAGRPHAAMVLGGAPPAS